MQRSLRHHARRPTHPGAILREDVLPALGMSQTEFAKRLGVSRLSVSGLPLEKRCCPLRWLRALRSCFAPRPRAGCACRRRSTCGRSHSTPSASPRYGRSQRRNWRPRGLDPIIAAYRASRRRDRSLLLPIPPQPQRCEALDLSHTGGSDRCLRRKADRAEQARAAVARRLCQVRTRKTPRASRAPTRRPSVHHRSAFGLIGGVEMRGVDRAVETAHGHGAGRRVGSRGIGNERAEERDHPEKWPASSRSISC